MGKKIRHLQLVPGWQLLLGYFEAMFRREQKAFGSEHNRSHILSVVLPINIDRGCQVQRVRDLSLAILHTIVHIVTTTFTIQPEKIIILCFISGRRGILVKSKTRLGSTRTQDVFDSIRSEVRNAM